MKHLITVLIISCSFIGLSQKTIYTKGYSDTEGTDLPNLEAIFTISHDYELLRYQSGNADVMMNIVSLEAENDNTLKLVCKDIDGDYLIVDITPEYKAIQFKFPNEEMDNIVMTQLFIITFIKDNE